MSVSGLRTFQSILSLWFVSESTGVLNNTLDIRDERPGTITIPQFFKENGYWTASVGKVFHNANHSMATSPGMSMFVLNDELPLVTAARKKFETERGSVEKAANRKAWRDLRQKVLVSPIRKPRLATGGAD